MVTVEQLNAAITVLYAIEAEGGQDREAYGIVKASLESALRLARERQAKRAIVGTYREQRAARSAAWAPVRDANDRVRAAKAAFANLRPVTPEWQAAQRELQDAQSAASLALAEYNTAKAGASAASATEDT